MKKNNSDENAKNWLEWTVFGLSVLLLLGVVVSLVYQAINVGDHPARLVVTMGKPLISNEQVRIPISVYNEGDVAANAVEIEVSGEVAGEKQTSGLTLEYVPHRAARKGWVSFPGNREPAGLSARVSGYEDP